MKRHRKCMTSDFNMDAGSYTWIFVATLLVACYDAFGIGANDVANSFATSVGSRSLKLWQACVIAVFTEFLGAVLLGANTAETIRGRIIDVSLFEDKPQVLMLLMFCALIGSSNFVMLATRFGMPVSTTHAIVGGIIGAGIAALGPSAVVWGYDGVTQIVVSWIISPLIAGIVASLLFLATKYTVLVRQNSFEWGLHTISLYFFATFSIVFFFFTYKGSPALKLNNQPIGVVLGIVFGFSTAIALFSQIFFVPWVRRTLEGREQIPFYLVFMVHCLPKPYHPREQSNGYEAFHNNEPATEQLHMETFNGDEEEARNNTAYKTEEVDMAEYVPSSITDPKNKLIVKESSPQSIRAVTPVVPEPVVQVTKDKVLGFLLHGVRQEIVDHDADKLHEMHNVAAKYESKTEALYSFLQITTASFASFAHGSNDVANAVGPLSVVFFIWQTGTVDVSGKTPVPLWVLAMGGVFIDLGLSIYGYKIMRSLGNRLTFHSPSRGFCMELGAMLTVLTASRLSLPVSTTHCITGATAGVGLCNGDWRAINWRLLAWCMCSWIVTLPCAGLVSGIMFAIMAYSPKIPGYNG